MRMLRTAYWTVFTGVASLLVCAQVAYAQPECVPECPDVPGENVLELVPVTPCIQPGEQVVVELGQRNLQQLVRGQQSFMAFDPASMQVISVEPTEEPFGWVLLNRYDNVAGTIDLITGIRELPPPQEPTQADAVLARITFEALIEDCDLDPEIFGSLVCFREHNPPTRFSDLTGLPIYPCLKFARVKIDGTKAIASNGCPDDVELQCPPEPCDSTVPGWVDNCDPDLTIDCSDEDNGGSGCVGDPLIITRTFWAQDCSLNYAECVQIITVVDDTDPVIEPEAQNKTVECNPDALQDWLADHGGARATDNCTPPSELEWSYDYDWIPGCCATGYADVTFTVRDACGNWDQTQARFTSEDTMPPVIDPDAQDETVECDGEGNTAEYEAWKADHGGARATDECCGPDELTWTYSDPVWFPGDCCDTGYWLVTFRVTDDCGWWAETSPVKFIIEDTTPPVVDMQAYNKYVECDGEGNTAEYEAWKADHGGAQATDECCDPDELTWSYVEDWQPLCCATGYWVVTFTVTDDCGYSADTSASFVINDTTPPVIDPDAQEMTVECDGLGNTAEYEAWKADHGGAGATDVCCDPDELIWTYQEEWFQKCCTTGYWLVTFTVTDDCGNPAHTSAVKFTIVDTTAPVFDPPCEPELIKVFPNPGDCHAYIDLPDYGGYDICCGDGVLVEHFRSDGKPWGEPFDPGETNVWWTITDDCGNGDLCMKVVQVEDWNLVEVYVEIPGPFANVLSRCVDFKLWTCPDTAPAMTVDEEVVFVMQGQVPPFTAGVAQLRVECTDGFEYTCMTAQDMLHTLRSTDELSIEVYEHTYGYDRLRYVAEYTIVGENALIPGNLDACQFPEDWFIDILDFGVFSWQWGQHYRDGQPVLEPPYNGHTPCPACDYFPHADIDGNGVVFEPWEFTIIRNNILKEYQPNCCGQPGDVVEHHPVMEISVAELIDRGWGHLAAGDLNHDGWLNEEDMVAFMNGARPRKPASAQEHLGG